MQPLQRKPFTSETNNSVPISKGEHRRHIISNHLMKSALQAWIDAHAPSADIRRRVEMNFQLMNNYQPNLHAGDGAVNSAIGMFTNNAKRSIESGKHATPQELGDALGRKRGFQQQTQDMLVDPVLTAFSTSEVISQSQEAAITYAYGLVDSTDFDWPAGGNPHLFSTWSEMYNVFLSLRNGAAHYDIQGLGYICQMFLKLPDPCR